jgi:hypothetical protein
MRTWPVAPKALRLAGSFAYRNPIVKHPDRKSRENSFADRVDPLIGGSLIGYLDVYSIPPYKRSLHKVRILLSDILGWRRPVAFIRESCPVMGGTL